MKSKSNTKSNSSKPEEKSNIKKSTTGNNNHSVDEDWSIISSSSDFDDERSTTSSTDQQYKNNFDPIQEGEDNEGINHSKNLTDSFDQSILKVPKLIAGQKDHQFIKQSSISSSPRINSVSSISDSITSSNSNSASALNEELSNSINVGSKIKFFENLNNFNESIKQKSNEFYSNFAKIKIDQLNKYIYDQHSIQGGVVEDGVKLDQELTQPTKENSEVQSEKKSPLDETDLDDTIELVKSIDKYHESQLLKYEQEQNQNQIRKLNKPRRIPEIKTPLGVKILSAIGNFLESNSDYLYYYLFVFLVGLIPTIYLVNNYLIQPTPTIIIKPPTLNDKIINYWNNLIYEETELSNNNQYGGFFGLYKEPKKFIKVNRFSKVGESLKTHFQKDFLKLKNVGKEVDKFVLTNIAPNFQKLIIKTENGLLLTTKNLKIWSKQFEDFSGVEFKKFENISKNTFNWLSKNSKDLFNQRGEFCDKSREFLNNGSKYFEIFLNNANKGSKTLFNFSKNLIQDEKENLKSFVKNIHKSSYKINQFCSKEYLNFKYLVNEYSPKFHNFIKQESSFIYNRSVVFKSFVHKWVVDNFNGKFSESMARDNNSVIYL
ncbi:uncharacterized protein KGF55_003232 [Candida pseudojiufengensis]|uniref:uncharacterized protein n=1 Tax=Candida pseudojiufengensis TaxID=497109 RepID=UPI002224E9E7|nr:uncharacterized protein KGF55_003232 [Candida pseudojiufengensis]KAI5962156.1 hypothetical protein KGF55_003232 [Candida pseudojiufengensis]